MKIKVSILIYSILVVGNVFAQKDSNDNIITIANNGYMSYLEKIPNGNEILYGFISRAEFKLVKIGKPYQIITLNDDFFKDEILVRKNYLTRTDEWRVPLLVNGEYRALLTVGRINGELQVVGLGAADLAKELNEFALKHPSIRSNLILRIYQMVSDYILLYKDDTSAIEVYPLVSAKISLGEEAEDMYSLSQVLLIIKKKMEQK